MSLKLPWPVFKDGSVGLSTSTAAPDRLSHTEKSPPWFIIVPGAG